MEYFNAMVFDTGFDLNWRARIPCGVGGNE